jgi:hypothetical protein
MTDGLHRTLAALLEVLLPGDELFPCGSTLGLEDLLRDRLLESIGTADLDALTTALAAGGAPFASLSPADRVPVVARLQREHPALFDQLAKTVYLTYYQAPPVQDAIRALGFAYNPTPLPAGYEVGRFDAARDTPRHGRGRFVATDEVRRVDLGGLDFVTPPT